MDQTFEVHSSTIIKTGLLAETAKLDGERYLDSLQV